ncbi:uncharacterized protein N7482_008665 [Penicillium canariense]|uniref:Uncharacterized protein n=1 Tax=Penicillium canariense TaxID=189055 RepID=A0A9W9HWF0_9EURO|nr:uncharacterized protein N7482_008665 [Penicillium canariense]KAJ5157565.1 hypothetical protein N7482_008665 [Penicillium canariense]
MKVITANFVTCAVKECKTSPLSFPLHFHDAELELQELDFQPEFIRNVVPRIDWDSLRVTANELGFPSLPESKPEGEALGDEQTLKDLHRLLLETQVMEGKLSEGNKSTLTSRRSLLHFVLLYLVHILQAPSAEAPTKTPPMPSTTVYDA